MKTIYKVLFPIGFEVQEVSNDFPTAIPFVEIKPLDIANPQSQYFDFERNAWIEAVVPEYGEQLKLLENLHTGLEQENARLKAANESLEKETNSIGLQVTQTQIALVEVYEMILGGE